VSDPDYRTLNSKEDFAWYCQELDVKNRYKHRHAGTPKEYPCGVLSVWGDDPNGPYYYDHSFVYRQEVTCDNCGHKHFEWPKQAT
jgi:hypothetical protein